MREFEDMPVGPDEYSDVALMMAAVREWPSEEFAHDLDARVTRRFAPVAATAGARRTGRGRLPRWAAGPAALVAAGAVAAIVVVSTGALRSAPRANFGAVTTNVVDTNQPSSVRKAPASGGAASSTAASSSAVGVPLSTQSLQSTAATAAPVAPGSKQIQSAQISLTTPNAHVDQVAQEVFDVVADEHGTVGSSKITAATSSSGGGYAFFTLSIPTSNLQDAMTQLSRLRYAAVSSRTDASQNVSGQYGNDQRRLSDAQALRISLLKQLQTADSETAIDSIEAQIKSAEAQISSWQSALRSLQHQISYSDVSVQINSAGLPVPLAASSRGFTIGRAGHDAVRVLVVAAGVALIALAVLVPVGLIAALLAWTGLALRQRRREHALDAVE